MKLRSIQRVRIHLQNKMLLYFNKVHTLQKWSDRFTDGTFLFQLIMVNSHTIHYYTMKPSDRSLLEVGVSLTTVIEHFSGFTSYLILIVPCPPPPPCLL